MGPQDPISLACSSFNSRITHIWKYVNAWLSCKFLLYINTSLNFSIFLYENIHL